MYEVANTSTQDDDGPVIIEDLSRPSLRDQFAMAAMNGLLSHPVYGMASAEWISEYAYKQADVMLKERERKT